jgi:hypothetical protein
MNECLPVFTGFCESRTLQRSLLSSNMTRPLFQLRDAQHAFRYVEAISLPLTESVADFRV